LTSRETSPENSGLRLARLPDDGAPVLAVTGELDVYEAPALRTELFAIVDEGHARVVVDCAGMGFIDSAGLAVLVDAQRRLAGHGGELVLRGLRLPARRIFEITDTIGLFTLEAPIS
jgi:anti-sigma B factor antagonist